jgi:hypothetical protein
MAALLTVPLEKNRRNDWQLPEKMTSYEKSGPEGEFRPEMVYDHLKASK